MKRLLLLLLIATSITESKAQMPGGSFGQYQSWQRSHFIYMQIYNKRKEEGKNVKPFQREEGGLIFMPILAHMDHEITRADFKSNMVSTKKNSVDITALAYGATSSTYYPVNKISPTSLMAISLMMNATVFTLRTKDLPSGNGETYALSAVGFQFGVPVGLEYKSGCDAALNKTIKSCFAIGAGINPTVNFSFYNNRKPLSFRPYIKAEMGFFARRCFKIRAMYSMGKTDYINLEESGVVGSNDYSSLLVRDRIPGTLMVSLLVNALSGDWEDGAPY